MISFKKCFRRFLFIALSALLFNGCFIFKKCEQCPAFSTKNKKPAVVVASVPASEMPN